jgi:hypothetical protein
MPGFDPPQPATRLVGRVAARRRGKRLLSLQQGPGRWLNRHLAALATLELRLMPPAIATTVEPPLPPPLFSATLLLPFARLMRRLLRIWGALVTMVANAAAQLMRQ